MHHFQLIKGSQRLLTVTVVLLSTEMIWNQPIEKEHLPIFEIYTYVYIYMSVYIYHHGDHVSQILPIPNIHQVHWSGISLRNPHLEWVFTHLIYDLTNPKVWLSTPRLRAAWPMTLRVEKLSRQQKELRDLNDEVIYSRNLITVMWMEREFLLNFRLHHTSLRCSKVSTPAPRFGR